MSWKRLFTQLIKLDFPMVHPANQRFQILFLPRVAYHRTTGTFILFFCFRIRLKVFIPGEGRGSWHYSDEKERKKKRKKGRKEKGNQRHCTCKAFKHASTAVSSIKSFLGQDLKHDDLYTISWYFFVASGQSIGHRNLIQQTLLLWEVDKIK